MKYMPLVLLSALGLATLTADAKEGGVGNGGIAFVCRDTLGTITRAELLDLWEPIRFRIPRTNEGIDAQLERAIQWIGTVYPTKVQTLRDRVAFLKSRTIRLVHNKRPENLLAGEFLVDASKKLQATEDALPVYSPVGDGCGYEQVARYDWINDLGLRLAIEAEIYDSPHFSNTDRSALFLHEAIYEMYVTRRELHWSFRRSGYEGYPEVLKWVSQVQKGGDSQSPNSRFARHVVQMAFWNQEPLETDQYLVKHLSWVLADMTGSELQMGVPHQQIMTAFAPVLTLKSIEAVDANCTFTASRRGVALETFNWNSEKLALSEKDQKCVEKGKKCDAYAQRLAARVSVENYTIPGVRSRDKIDVTIACDRNMSSLLIWSTDQQPSNPAFITNAYETIRPVRVAFQLGRTPWETAFSFVVE